ncbi:MAG: SDR family NAD(P)-dependent oxidoreductase [Pseudomonadota bacterium]
MMNPSSVPELSERQQRWRSRYGSWAVVTGASDGIGRAIATSLAERGMNIALIARSRDLLSTLAHTCAEQKGVETLIVDVDLSDRVAFDRIAETTRVLDVGLLVACAGFGTSGPLVDADLENELDMIDVNCAAVLGLSHMFAKRFAQQGRGGMILMSSLLAFQGVPRAANYAATKAYVQTLAEGLKLELSPRGVDVLACAPGPIQSGFAARANMQMGFAQRPDEIAQSILDALGRRATVRPGWLSKALESAFIGQPRSMRTRILGLVMKGMTKHQIQ